MKLQQWTFTHPEHGSFSCTVPFSMYQILLDHGKIEDPYYRENDLSSRELSDVDCSAESTITLSEEDVEKTYQELFFYGIDTLCDLYVNDTFVYHAENMHRTHIVSVKGLLHEGENQLKLQFHSPLAYIRKEQAKHHTYGTPDAVDGFAHLRKAHCMFGWDWGPQLPDMGLFRDVELRCYDIDRIDDVMIHQDFIYGIKDDHAKEVRVSLQALTKQTKKEDLSDKDLTLTCTVTSPCGEETSAELVLGSGCVTLSDPMLWWPHGYGSQPLYTVTIDLYHQAQKIDSVQKKIGIRTLTVSTAKDRYGNEFCFVVNGVKIFAMGADYIPEDSLLPRVNRARTEQLIKDCVRANFNCIRVWGGGGYPSDDFFDLCDEYGLLIWQDFMFACMNAYLTAPFTASIKEEFKDNLRRIRHHAALGILCGNNEMETAVMHWPGVNNSELAKKDYLELYEHILPDLCAVYAPDTFYWPSSPSSGGGFDDPDNENRGDVHYWGAWHGSIPFESYRKYYFRFLSEFGFESFPSMKTIRSFAEPEDLNPLSNVLEDHQKCSTGNGKILTYLSSNYLYPYDFENLVYASQLLQLDAIRLGVEHYRRYRGRCMGSVYWQLNDCWPTASWASIDYFGRWKALMYGSRRFFAPVLLSAHEDGFEVTLSLANETRASFNGTIRFRVMDTDLNVYYESEKAASVKALTSHDEVMLDLTEYIQDHERERFLAYELLDENGCLISSSSLLFVKPKKFSFVDPKIRADITPLEESGSFRILVSAEKYAKYVEIDFTEFDVELSDNDFDLTSNKPFLLTARCSDPSVTAETLLNQLIVRSVYDIH